MLLLLITLIAQIEAPAPTQRQFSIVDLQASRRPQTYQLGLDSKYFIQPYLQVAGEL
jgi:hypothetical protein